MAPKKKMPAQLGGVFPHGQGWRVWAYIAGADRYGPLRQHQSQARKDLAKAQRCKALEEMQHYLQSLHAGAQQEAFSVKSIRPEPGSASSDMTAHGKAYGKVSGGRSVADKKQTRVERQRARQRSQNYKAKRNAREKEEQLKVRNRRKQVTQKFRFAQNARRKQEKFKVKKRLYEKSQRAKISRVQRRSARFWAPCLCNWSAVRSDVATRKANNAANFAPRFHADGRISILQHGMERFLPCPQEPAKDARQQQLDEFTLALQLRCRLGAINCRRLGSEQERERERERERLL